MKRCFLCARLLIMGCMLVWVAGARADNWPQWRGPDSNGISKETKLAAEWDEKKNVVWKLPMPGIGNSTPVIWEKRIFLTSADRDDLILLCVSTEGKELWKCKIGSGKGRYRGDEGNDVSASPSTDGKHVYAFFGTGDFACIDFEGKEVWKFNAQERYGKFRIMHGMHVTPVLHGDRLYVSLLHSGGMWVIALDKATGKEAWKAERKTDGRGEGQHSYASPCLWTNGKDEYLVVHGCDYATAHSLKDGSEIWRLGDLNPKKEYDATLRFVASPLATPDLIIIPTAKRRGVVAVKPDAKGEIKPGDAAEQWRLTKGTPDVPSPLVHDGLVYLSGETGTLTCLEAKTGKELYREDLHRTRYRASPMLADGKLYLTARDGTFTVVKAGSKFEQVAKNKLPDTFGASPAVSNGRIYLRGWETLYAIQEAK